MSVARDWAKRLSEKLSEEEFKEFAEFIDGCDDVEFSYEVNRINQKRHPELYVKEDRRKK